MGLPETPKPQTGDRAPRNAMGERGILVADGSNGQVVRLVGEPIAGGALLKVFATDAFGDPVQVSAVSGKNAEHFNATATDTPATLTFALESRTIIIDNVDAVDNLLVSFDGGTLFKTIKAGANLTIDLQKPDMVVAAPGGLTTDYEILVVQP